MCCFTSPWITKRCLSGSISVSPPRAITKCRPFGVIVPLRRWCGVLAALPRGSSLGLLSVRTTFCSNFDGWPYGGIGTPGARLQGPFVSGSAAALVSAEPPVVIAPAKTMPCPSNARRSSKPLPATGSSGGDALPSLRRLRMLMVLSPLTMVDDFGTYLFRRLLKKARSNLTSVQSSSQSRLPKGPLNEPGPPHPPWSILCRANISQKEELMKANSKTKAVALVGVALGALVMVVSGIVTALAQDTVRVRGTIERFDGSTYLVKARDGAELKVALADNPQIAGVVKASLSNIKQGSFVGVTAMPRADGSQSALEVHIFPEAMRGTGEGHYPWDLRPQSTMTNANVEQVVTAVDGQTLTLKYKDGEKKIFVPANTPIVVYVPGDKSDLKPGAKVFIAAIKQPDGTLQGRAWRIGRDGVTPPM